MLLMMGNMLVAVSVSLLITPSKASFNRRPKWTSDPLVQLTMMTAVLLSVSPSIPNILSFMS